MCVRRLIGRSISALPHILDKMTHASNMRLSQKKPGALYINTVIMLEEGLSEEGAQCRIF